MWFRRRIKKFKVGDHVWYIPDDMHEFYHEVCVITAIEETCHNAGIFTVRRVDGEERKLHYQY